MNDNNILYSCSILLFFVILICFKVNKNIAYLNLVIFLLYSSFLYYGFFFKSTDGTALAWWFYLAIITALQLIAVVIYLGIKYFKR